MDKERRSRFKSYFSGPPLRGDRAKLMDKTGLSKGRVTQLLDDDEPFGERAAANLAVKLGLPLDAFERESPVSVAFTSDSGPLPSDATYHPSELPLTLGVSQDLSLYAHTVPRLIRWEDLMQCDPLPLTFKVAVPDDSLGSSPFSAFFRALQSMLRMSLVFM